MRRLSIRLWRRGSREENASDQTMAVDRFLGKFELVPAGSGVDWTFPLLTIDSGISDTSTIARNKYKTVWKFMGQTLWTGQRIPKEADRSEVRRFIQAALGGGLLPEDASIADVHAALAMAESRLNAGTERLSDIFARVKSTVSLLGAAAVVGDPEKAGMLLRAEAEDLLGKKGAQTAAPATPEMVTSAGGGGDQDDTDDDSDGGDSDTACAVAASHCTLAVGGSPTGRKVQIVAPSDSEIAAISSGVSDLDVSGALVDTVADTDIRTLVQTPTAAAKDALRAVTPPARRRCRISRRTAARCEECGERCASANLTLTKMTGTE